MTVWSDGKRDVILGRKPPSEYGTIVKDTVVKDTVVKEWKSNFGDTIRKEYAEAMAAAKR